MAFAGGDMKIAVVIEAYDRASNVFKSVSKNVNILNNSFNQLKDVSNVFSTVGTHVETLNSKLSTLKNIASTVAGVLGGILAYQGLVAVKNALEDSIKSFADFEYTMETVANIMGMSREELETYTSKLLDLSKNTIYTAKQLAGASLVIARAGIKGEEAFAVLEAASKAAQASGEDLSNVLSVAISTVKTFGVKTEDISKVMDILVNAALNAKTSVSDIGTALSYVGAAASQIGWSIEDVVEAISILHDRGLEGSKAGMYLRQAIMDLVDPSAEAKKVMEELGIKVKDAEGNLLPLRDILDQLGEAFEGMTETEKMEALSKIFDTRPASAMALLLNVNREEWESLGEEISKTGTAAELSAKMMETTRGKLLQLQATMEALKIEVGAALAPALTGFAETAMDVMEKIKAGDWQGAFNVIKNAAETAFNNISSIVQTWWDSFVKWWESVNWLEVAQKIGEGIRTAFYNALYEVANILETINTWLDTVLSDPSIVEEWVNSVITWFETAMKGLLEPSEIEKGKTTLLDLVGKILVLTPQLGAKILMFSGLVVAKFIEGLGEKLPGLKDYLEEQFEEIKKTVLGIIDDLAEELKNKIKGAIDWVEDKIKGFKDAIVGVFEKIYKTLVGGSIWTELTEKMVEQWNTAINTIVEKSRMLRYISENVFPIEETGIKRGGREIVEEYNYYRIEINAERKIDDWAFANLIARRFVAEARMRGIL